MGGGQGGCERRIEGGEGHGGDVNEELEFLCEIQKKNWGGGVGLGGSGWM